jgi:hypothetical protein
VEDPSGAVKQPLDVGADQVECREDPKRQAQRARLYWKARTGGTSR